MILGCPESRCTESRTGRGGGGGTVVGNLPRRSTFLAALRHAGMGKGSGIIKEGSEKRENSSRA